MKVAPICLLPFELCKFPVPHYNYLIVSFVSQPNDPLLVVETAMRRDIPRSFAIIDIQKNNNKKKATKGRHIFFVMKKKIHRSEHWAFCGGYHFFPWNKKCHTHFKYATWKSCPLYVLGILSMVSSWTSLHLGWNWSLHDATLQLLLVSSRSSLG